MSSEFLSSYIANASDDIRLTSNKIVTDISYEHASSLSFFFRQKGACDFFHTGQIDGFFSCMHKSAGSYLYFLINGNDSDKRTSDNDAFFDAINAGLWECAKLIASNSRDSCNYDYEYEDDFLYSHFLNNYFFLDERKEKPLCHKILANYETVLDGDSSIRFNICKSFLDDKNDDFVDNFESFLVERAELIEIQIEREVMGEEVWSWARYFSNEGLALIQLAKTTGFAVDHNYAQIPELLRKPPSTVFDRDYWKEK